MGKLGISKLNVEKIKELHLQGKNDKEIANLLGYSHSSVCYVRRNILKYKPVLEEIIITKNQELSKKKPIKRQRLHTIQAAKGRSILIKMIKA